MPRPSEEKRLMSGWGAELYSKYREDENNKRALFYAVLALEEAFGVYRSALRKYAEEREKAMQRVEVGKEPFKRVMYVADLGLLTQLAEEEETAFEKALSTLRERLNEYAVKYDLRDLLNVDEDAARRLAEAEYKKLPTFKDISFGVKALAALMAYRERELGRKSAYGTAAKHWLEEGGSAWLLYYSPKRAYDRAEKARAEKPVAVEEMVAEGLRRLFLKPGADHHRGLVELLGSGKLALELENKTESSYVFKLYRLEEGGLKELEGVRLRIAKVEEGASITYVLELDAERRELFRQELEVMKKAAEELKERWHVEDLFPYMLSWLASDVAIRKAEGKKKLKMTTSHLWQVAETKVLFGWFGKVGLRVGLTLEGPKLQVIVEAPLENLDKAIKRSAEDGWLKTLGIKAESWDGLKEWVVENWSGVVEAAVKRLGEGVRGELEALRNKLNDDKIAREVVAPALLLIQAERLGVNETTLRYFAAVISGAIGGDGYVSAAMKRVELASGERGIALLWAAALASHGIKAEARGASVGFNVVTSGDDAARLARLYFLYGPPLLEGNERIINHKLAEAMKLAAEGLNIRWEGLRRTKKGHVAADLTISEAGIAVKYNVYLRGHDVLLEFQSTDRSRAELAARLLRLAGVGAELKKKEDGEKDVWRVIATTDMLAAGREELRKALAEVVKAARKSVGEEKAKRWLKKLERGRVLMEGWPKYHVGLDKGALVVRYQSTNFGNIEQVAQWLEKRGLKRSVHFSVKMPDGGKAGYVSILKVGLAYAAYLSVHSENEDQRKLAAAFVELILRRAEEACGGAEPCAVYEKAKEIVEEGKAWGSLKLEGFAKRVEVGGREHVVKVLGGGAEFDKGRGNNPLLRIRITAEIDGVRREYAITFGRYGKDNAAVGRAYARAEPPDGRETDAERISALIKALTGKEPRIRRRSDGKIEIVCGREHLDGFMRYSELAKAIMKWLEETGR
jgi:hypothetical protein